MLVVLKLKLFELNLEFYRQHCSEDHNSVLHEIYHNQKMYIILSQNIIYNPVGSHQYSELSGNYYIDYKNN